MSLVKPSDAVTVQFTVTDPATGAATDADSLPTGTLVRNGANTGETVTVANVTVGVYSAAVTIPAGYAAGDEVQLRIAATVGGVAGQGVVWTAQVDTVRVGELNDFDPAADNVTVGDILAAALANFITDDTGETTAVDGSVAKIAQGAAGLTVQDIWGHTTRTLTQGAASVTAAVVGDEVTVYRGTTMSVSLTGLGDLSGYSKLYFSVKDSFGDTDDEAILRVSDETEGLKRVNGDSPTDAENGTITIDDANNGDITITVDELETAKLPVRGDLNYDVKGIGSGGDVDLLSVGVDKFTISGDVTRAIT